jgi:hypothetical protein
MNKLNLNLLKWIKYFLRISAKDRNLKGILLASKYERNAVRTCIPWTCLGSRSI